MISRVCEHQLSTRHVLLAWEQQGCTFAMVENREIVKGGIGAGVDVCRDDCSLYRPSSSGLCAHNFAALAFISIFLIELSWWLHVAGGRASVRKISTAVPQMPEEVVRNSMPPAAKVHESGPLRVGYKRVRVEHIVMRAEWVVQDCDQSLVMQRLSRLMKARSRIRHYDLDLDPDASRRSGGAATALAPHDGPSS